MQSILRIVLVCVLLYGLVIGGYRLLGVRSYEEIRNYPMASIPESEGLPFMAFWIMIFLAASVLSMRLGLFRNPASAGLIGLILGLAHYLALPNAAVIQHMGPVFAAAYLGLLELMLRHETPELAPRIFMRQGL